MCINGRYFVKRWKVPSTYYYKLMYWIQYSLDLLIAFKVLRIFLVTLWFRFTQLNKIHQFNTPLYEVERGWGWVHWIQKGIKWMSTCDPNGDGGQYLFRWRVWIVTFNEFLTLLNKKLNIPGVLLYADFPWEIRYG